jgi:CheY-like chemotaxis protein
MEGQAMHLPRILVVEDEALVALDLQSRLAELGYDVPDPVASGDSALMRIEESRPDLVLMDIKIEGELDGIATASRIPPDYKIPVIFLTAYSDAATVSRADATKPYGYLLKPCNERELHALIQTSLGQRAAESEAQGATLFSASAATGRMPVAEKLSVQATSANADLGWGVDHAALPPPEAVPLFWQKSGSTLFAALPSASGTIQHRLIVEQLPLRNGWDWAVWRQGQPGDQSRHGRANSAVAAMTAAESAVRIWIEGTD